MPFVPLQLPKGAYRNGTDLMSQGRWRDVNLVRWHEDVLRPVGGWRQRGSVDFDGVSRKMMSWEDNTGDGWLAVSTHDALYVMTIGNVIYNITPTDLAAGRVDATLNTGYGGGSYGLEAYGIEREQDTSVLDATTWSLDNWGEYLVACSPDDGVAYEWQLDVSIGSEEIINGGFDADSDWTKGTGWTIAAGVASFSGSAIAALSQALSGLTSGDAYEVTFTAASASENEGRVRFTGSSVVLNSFIANGSNTFRFTADDTTGTLEFEPAAAVASAFDIDNVSVKRVPVAKQIANAPIDNKAIFVTEERFLVCLGAGGDQRKIQWSDREDNTLWTPAATNEAGDFLLQTEGNILRGIRTRGQSLILTTLDAHTMTYSGPPFVYGVERVGTSCGLIAANAVASVDAGVIWMGQRGFYLYSGGQVQNIPCEVGDYVFTEMNKDQTSKVSCVVNSAWNEIWWFYPSENSVECDRYVAFDYAENIWSFGELDRTAGIDRGAFRTPMFFAPNGELYEHEVGYNYGSSVPFAETGPISIGNGDQISSVTQLIPDERTQGDVTALFKARFYPNDTERNYGPYSMSAPTSVRFSGRQVRMRVSGNASDDWRVGIMRLDVKPRGLR